MCMNCGCGEPEARHKETDITLDDIRQASAGSSMDETVRNMRTSLDQIGQSGNQGASVGREAQPGSV